jgi:ElaA protein
MIDSIAVTNDIAACRALRRRVFIEEQGVSEADELDDLDPDCLHVLAVKDGIPVGSARIHIVSRVAKVGRVCVLKPHRGTGLGAALIREAMIVSKGQADTVKLGAQLHALGFYEALGFIAYGPVYDDAGIDHRDMAQDL